jgi:hypothetical protein
VYDCSLLERLTSSGVEVGQDPEDGEDFANMTREEQLRILEQKSWVKNIDFNKVTPMTLFLLRQFQEISGDHRLGH